MFHQIVIPFYYVLPVLRIFPCLQFENFRVRDCIDELTLRLTSASTPERTMLLYFVMRNSLQVELNLFRDLLN